MTTTIGINLQSDPDRLRGTLASLDRHSPHCCGDAFPHVALPDLIQLQCPLPPPNDARPLDVPLGHQRPLDPPSHAVAAPSPKPSIARPRSEPLVTCIMPTYNRRAFVPRAVEYFLRQDYSSKELIVVDDGSDPVGDLIPDDECIQYIRLPKRATIGAKRNLACEQARGELIAHWDDDDWMATWRLTYQLEGLLKAQADLCGLDTLLFLDAARCQVWVYTYPKDAQPWLAGGTLLYRKSAWAIHPFPELNAGEDTRFVWSDHTRKIVALSNNRFYVAVIHAENTSPKITRGPRWSRWVADLEAVMGEDLRFYQASPTTEAPAGGTRMKLNLGCCDAPLPGYINVDIIPGPGVTVADLRQPWPWEENSIEHVRAWDVIEHLPDKIFTMNELWRVLMPGGTADIAVPTTDGSGAFQDPTHVSFWNRRSFIYYQAGNPYRERFARYYGIRASFRTLREQMDHSVDGPRLTIILQAVKP
jgi:Glycosyl transferase family 2